MKQTTATSWAEIARCETCWNSSCHHCFKMVFAKKINKHDFKCLPIINGGQKRRTIGAALIGGMDFSDACLCFPGNSRNREERTDVHLQSGHRLVVALQRRPVSPAECHCLRSDGTHFSGYFQVQCFHLAFQHLIHSGCVVEPSPPFSNVLREDDYPWTNLVVFYCYVSRLSVTQTLALTELSSGDVRFDFVQK